MGVNVKLFSLRTMFCGQGQQICYELCHLKKSDVNVLVV